MDIGGLFAALKANAEKAHKPTAVPIEGVGTIYVRQRTVNEFEELSDDKAINGSVKMAPALARLITDENGNRLPAEHHAELARLLGDQPEDVLRVLVDAADGKTDIKKAAAPGN